jgi:pimeloyl-ACP methyl ester carboxylesterase
MELRHLRYFVAVAEALNFTKAATEDKMIPPPARRAMAGRAKARMTEVPGSHAIYVSKPDEVAEVIRQAADSSI